MASNVLVKRWAILIGIDFYMTGNGPKGSGAKEPRSLLPLRGSVNDITSMEKFLKETYSVEEDCIVKLTASQDPSLSTKKRPTYENIVGAFEQVIKDAKSGDLVYIQYCGHGALSKPDPSKKLPICELLVPTDLCNGGQYLYDTEVSALLKKMTDKGLVVTITLDSCHSGSGTRGDITDIHRGIGEVDAPRPNTELAAELEKRYLSTDSDQSRHGQKRKSLLLEPEGYELFAACRQDEKAYEIDTGDCWRGAFSYSLLETLKKWGPQLTHGVLSESTHDDTLSTSLEKDHTQTPVFAGDAGRYFFDVLGAQHISTIAVLDVNKDGAVTLNAGEAQGVCVESEYAIYPKGTLVFETSSVLAHVRVQKTFGLKSEARLLEDCPRIAPGCRAVLSKYGRPTLVQRPQYTTSDELHRKAVNRFNLVGDQYSYSTGIAPLKLIDPGSPGSRGQFCVVANEHGKYELWTEAPNERIPNFIPCDDPEVFLRRLMQVARYKVIKDINNINSDVNLSLRGMFEFEVEGSRPTGKTNEVEVDDGEKVKIVFKNNSDHTLNLTILDLTPLWGVSQLYPENMPHGEDIRSGCSCPIEIKMSLPKGFPFKSGVDTFKAFVTRDGAKFKSLEMEDLDMTTGKGIYVDYAEAKGTNPDRHGKVITSPERSAPSESWGTSQISVRVSKVTPAEEQPSALIAVNTCSD